ncbi:MAG: PilZ domain-containing protein [Algisphaera sp.]
MLSLHKPELTSADQSLSDTARLWLSDQQWISLLTRVRRGASDSDAVGGLSEATGDRRHPRRAPSFLCLIRLGPAGPEGTYQGTYQVSTRNISSGGIGFVHDRNLVRGTRATVALQPAEGEGLVLSARVAWCRDLSDEGGEGPSLFQVGVQFDQPVDIDPFIHAA